MQATVIISGSASSLRHHSARALITGCIAVLTTLLAGCGSNEAGGPGATIKGKLDTCALIASADPDALLDIADGKAYPVISMQTEDGTQATSQCTYTSESTARTIGLLVKFSSSEINPPTKAEFIESQIAAEYMSAGDDLASAIAAGPDIQGLGDLAFSYKLMRSNLHVFWARHYQMVVMTSGNVSAEKALKINERIAQQVLKAFPG